VTWSQALDAGLTAAQVRTQVRRDGWLAKGGGVLVPRPGELEPHLLEAAVRLLRLDRRAVISHDSAGLLHGFPYVDVPDPVTVTVERAHRGERGVYVGRFFAEHVTHVGGLPVMTPARTVVDLLRTAPDRGAAQALADGVGDSRWPGGDVDAVLKACAGWPGIRQAREAWEHRDSRAESPLESRCRVWFRDGGLPRPDLQVVVGEDRTSRTARVDFLFREQRTVVEADGRVKYTERGVLWAEKQREDWLRDLGFEVVRATWADGDDGGADIVRRVLRAFARARHAA
jgi:hypothetical protein